MNVLLNESKSFHVIAKPMGPIEAHNFLIDAGSGYILFIPVVERNSESENEQLKLVLPGFWRKCRGYRLLP